MNRYIIESEETIIKKLEIFANSEKEALDLSCEYYEGFKDKSKVEFVKNLNSSELEYNIIDIKKIEF